MRVLMLGDILASLEGRLLEYLLQLQAEYDLT